MIKLKKEYTFHPYNQNKEKLEQKFSYLFQSYI